MESQAYKRLPLHAERSCGLETEPQIILAEMVPTNTSTHTTSAYVEWYWSGRTASIAIVISRTTKPARGTTPRNATPYRLPQPLKSPRRQRVASKSTTIGSALSGRSTCLASYLMGATAPARAGHHICLHRPVRIVCCVVAHQDAAVGAPVVGNRCALILSNHIDVEIHQPFAGHAGRARRHSMSRVAHRAGESILRHVAVVLWPARVRQNSTQVVAFGAHRIRPLRAQVRRWIRVGDHPAWYRRLACLIVSFQYVRVDRTVWAHRTSPNPAEFPVVVAVVAVGAENPRSHQPRR